MLKKDYTFVTIDSDDALPADAVIIDVEEGGALLMDAVMIDDSGFEMPDGADFITLADDTVMLSEMDMLDLCSGDMEIDCADISFLA